MDASVLREVATNIAGYFRDFLESDFKRIQAPSRRVILQTEQGFRAGMRIKPYQDLNADIWKLLQRPSGEPLHLRLTPRKYTRPLSEIILKVVTEQIGAISEYQLIDVRKAVADHVSRTYANSAGDPEEWIEGATDALLQEVADRIIKPLIARLDGPLQRQAYSVIDSLYSAELDMVTLVAAEMASKLPEVLARHHAKRDDAAVDAALESFLTLDYSSDALKRFFDSFVTADAFLEFRDLETFASTSEGVALYLYLGSVKHGSNLYPLFFMPVQIEKLPEGTGYELNLINQLFANRAAIDFILQETADAKMREWVSPISDRIIYLQPEQSVYEVTRGLFALVANSMDLAGHVQFSSQSADAATAEVTMSSALYLCAFEKGAEALVNDYENLINLARTGGAPIVDLFEGMVKGVLQENPKSIRAAVEAEWDGLPVVDRVVFDSPIPLNEEQRKILLAVRNPEGRIIVVEGPPGTGKSHTITAIAADCAFTQRSCLVLSDKAEALEVVQNKLSDAMSRVRHDPNFPNPILRLGRQHANFKKLVGTQAVNQVTAYAKAMNANAPHIEAEREDTKRYLKEAITKTLGTLGSIEVSQVLQLHDQEAKIREISSDLLQHIQQTQTQPGLLARLDEALEDVEALRVYLQGLAPEAWHDTQSMKLIATRDRVVGEFIRERPTAAQALLLYEALDPAQVRDVASAALQYRQLRMPLVGYLFRGAAVRELELKLNALPARHPLLLKSDCPALELMVEAANDLRQRLERAGLADALARTWPFVAARRTDERSAMRVLALMEAMTEHPQLTHALLDVGSRHIIEVLHFLRDWSRMRLAFASAPEFDYVGTKEKLDKLNTSRMNAHVDARLVDFMENHRADARTLATLISQRQKFPEEKFEAVRTAFPVIIAGIREFGEYMPLMPEMFDVVVIDEGSQVSVAQALPAILRAKKVVVLGDTKQFANVKSSNASIATNEKYRSTLVNYFKRNVRSDAGTLQRLAMFDVKKSILEFCSLAANYSIMLRKHFRSYPELISYSSKTFYDRQLQAIKIRGVPIEEVIEFSQVDIGDHPVTRSTNPAEAEFIMDRLLELLEEESPPTVGIITPFREQHSLLTKRLFAHAKAQEFEDKLRLKIMTFDSCQGEERKIIFYSMVASPAKDALNYIFPADTKVDPNAVEEKLKVQRLNVGFSRAQEMIWIVHSQPLELFRGSIGQALNHFAQVRVARLGSVEQTDASSPMEARVLQWLQSTQFVLGQPDDVEILPQFPIGEYLKQLDPTYQHPAYRVDFLVSCRTPKGVLQIVVEYDGWDYHFEQGRNVHVGNHQRYLKDADIERQLTLESYGYRFIRINRFNLGQDPVATLDERLARIVESTTGEQHSKFVERLREQAEGMMNNNMRQCGRCESIKPMQDFWDRTLKSGAGAYGRVCMACKGASANKPSGRRGRYSISDSDIRALTRSLASRYRR